MRSIFSDEITGFRNILRRRLVFASVLRDSLSTPITQRPFRPNFSAWLASSYKPLTVFILSAFVLVLCYVRATATIMPVITSAIITGAASIILSILLSPEWIQKIAIQATTHQTIAWKISPNRALTHPSTLVIGLLGLLMIYSHYQDSILWTVFPTLSLLGGYSLGGSVIMLLVCLLEEHASSPTKKSNSQRIIPERLDVVAGAVVAGMLVGTTMADSGEISLSAGVVWLPAVLAWCGVCASLSMNYIFKWIELPLVIKRIISVGVMLLISYVLVDLLLPIFWVIDGHEKLSSEIFLAAGVGVVGGFFLLEAAHGYAWVRTLYYAWMIQHMKKEAWFLKIFRHLFRNVCVAIPIVLVAYFLKHTFEYVGLYGIVVAAITLFSNLNVHLLFNKKASA